MLKFLIVAALGVVSLSPAMADQARKAAVKEASQPTKGSPAFARWIEREKLTAPKSSKAWVSGEAGVRVLAIRR